MLIDTIGKLTNLKHFDNVMHLPLHCTLPNGSQVVIDSMSDSHITDMYELISMAAINGTGYGVDEYPTEKDFRNEIKDGHNFFVYNKGCGKMIAAFSLINSMYYRGTDCTFADPIIIVKKSQRGKGIGEFIFRHIVIFSKRLGYMGIYIDTFSNNVAMTKIIERSPGFQRVGYLPVGGKMPDGTIVGTNLYFKDLTNSSEESVSWALQE
uniref:N-acetyltransferase domain-containing protein n=1 Tax=Arion vulgaris TaxID=1028688 RepID=A0A0B6ZKP1_9EUPU